MEGFAAIVPRAIASQLKWLPVVGPAPVRLLSTDCCQSRSHFTVNEGFQADAVQRADRKGLAHQIAKGGKRVLSQALVVELLSQSSHRAVHRCDLGEALLQHLVEGPPDGKPIVHRG